MSTFGADAFHHVVDAAEGKAFGQRYHRRRNVFEAECPVASFAMKVSMQVVDRTRAIGAAYGILEGTCSVVDAMNEVV